MLCQAGQLAVEKGARDRDKYECRISGDFGVGGSAAVMAETGADFADPRCYVFGAGAARVDKFLAERLAVGPLLYSGVGGDSLDNLGAALPG